MNQENRGKNGSPFYNPEKLVPKFSIVMIAKNEANTLPKCMKSLEEFTGRGGEVILLDTGSTDSTVEIAENLGCKVEKAGDTFVRVIDEDTAEKINKRFICKGETPIVKAGDRLFDFASARNYATSLATNDMICTLDADEAYTTLDIDKINKLIDEGHKQFEYQFVFAHDQYGKPAIQFVQSKFFDRRSIKWVGIVHETLAGEDKRVQLGSDIIFLEHWQEQGKDHRSNYLVGLSLDCYENPDKDRQSHYFARELMYTGHPKSALREFERHISMDRWPAEKGQSMIFMGDCYGMLNQPKKQVEWYSLAFKEDPYRRESLIKLARFYRSNNRPIATIAYAKAALEIPWTDYYANDKGMYEQEPHELLYWGYGWIGNVAEARKHIKKALEIQPRNPQCLRDTKYYFEYADQGIDGWMRFEELEFLYETAKIMDSICEMGSWKGRSTHALLSGCKGEVTAVDTFMGSAAENDWSHNLAKQQDIFAQFEANVGKFQNLYVRKGLNQDIVKEIPDRAFDMVFIDGGHTYEEVREDIRNWKSKAKIMFCGHDYSAEDWMGVIRAVDEELGGPDEVHGTIWVKWIHQPKVSICIPTLERPKRLHKLIQIIKENAGYSNYEIVVKADTPIPNNEGFPKTLKRAVDASTGELVMFIADDCLPQKDFLKLAVMDMVRNFPDLDGLVGLNDSGRTDDLPTQWLASKKLLPSLDGEFYHTGYFHCYGDNELMDRTKKLERYFHSKLSKVIHENPGQGKGVSDDVYKSAYNSERVEHDRKLYEERKKKYA